RHTHRVRGNEHRHGRERLITFGVAYDLMQGGRRGPSVGSRHNPQWHARIVRPGCATFPGSGSERADAAEPGMAQRGSHVVAHVVSVRTQRSQGWRSEGAMLSLT